MLEHSEALEKILAQTRRLSLQKQSLRDCLGLAAARDIHSPLPFPHFDNSAVDGFALGRDKGAGFAAGSAYRFKGEIAAGSFFTGTLLPGEALQIFTGAPVPAGTQTVVMQEHAGRRNGHVVLLKTARPGSHIRRRGEDFRKGTTLVRKGAVLGPAQLAVLAAAGVGAVPVYPSPKIALLATGRELLKSGEKLQGGKIYDSNSILLDALVRQSCGMPQPLGASEDDLPKIRAAVRRGLQSDALIISGGVSVGKYDFVKEALEQEGVRQIFWKVNIKPGKPLYFGKKGRTLVFGLPGNPVSVYVTFEEFVKPALFKLRGVEMPARSVSGRLSQDFQNGDRLHFVRVDYQAGRILPLKGQGSHQIGSLAQSNALWTVPANAAYKKNQRVQVRLMDTPTCPPPQAGEE